MIVVNFPLMHALPCYHEEEREEQRDTEGKTKREKRRSSKGAFRVRKLWKEKGKKKKKVRPRVDQKRRCSKKYLERTNGHSSTRLSLCSYSKHD